MNQWWIIAFIVWSIALGILGFTARGWKDNASIEAAKDRQEIAVIQQERKDQTITNGVDHAYQKNIATVNLSYDAIRQRLYGIPSTGLPTISKSSARLVTATCSNKLPRSTQEALINLAKQADMQKIQLIYLQKWIKAEGLQ